MLYNLSYTFSILLRLFRFFCVCIVIYLKIIQKSLFIISTTILHAPGLLHKCNSCGYIHTSPCFLYSFSFFLFFSPRALLLDVGLLIIGARIHLKTCIDENADWSSIFMRLLFYIFPSCTFLCFLSLSKRTRSE